MMNKAIGVSLAAALLLGLGGCASSGGEGGSSASGDWSDNFYLRGVFTWWDAEEEYKVTKITDDKYMSSAELVADGQPYDFKFADASWSAGKNCGYLSKEDEEVVLDKKVKVNCSAVFENFKFTPPEDGVYNFYFDKSGETPVIWVEAAE